MSGGGRRAWGDAVAAVFAFADGVNQRDGFREAKAVVSSSSTEQRAGGCGGCGRGGRAGPGRGE